MTTHTLFEAGVATTIKPMTFNDLVLSDDDLRDLRENNFLEVYKTMITQIDDLQMYEQFKQAGWTRKLALQTKQELLPLIIKAVIMAWYDAYHRAREESPE